jgi:hypothetical protein
MLSPLSATPASTQKTAFGMPLKVTLPTQSINERADLLGTLIKEVNLRNSVAFKALPAISTGEPQDAILFSAVTPPPNTHITNQTSRSNWPLQGGEKQAIQAWWQQLTEKHPTLKSLQTTYLDPSTPHK